ncbi:MAG: AAA family ATPase [Chitinophagaceae bacterium]
MKEKLIIKNFGPIKDVELELGRFTVLIGEQATGKSTVAKLLAVCRYFSFIATSSVAFEEGLISWGLHEFIKDNTYIYYKCEHYIFDAKNISSEVDDGENGGVLFLNGLQPLSAEFKNLKDEQEKLGLELSHLPTSFLQNEVARVMDNPFYLPAERGLQSIFSLGKSSIQNIADSLFNQLSNLYIIERLFKSETIIEPLSITYKNIDGRGYIKKQTDTKFYSLFNAATGYQSTIPVVLSTKYYQEIRKKRKTFIIEEPELNLYPTAQHKLVEYLAENIAMHDNSLLITTHSPYILTSLNNLIYSYKLGQSYPEETEKIVSKKYWLDQDEVTVYKMLSDGTCEDIFDRKEGLIKAEKIDGISGMLNEQFEALLNIEFEKK